MDGLQDGVDGGDVGHVKGVRDATTAGEDTADVSSAIDDDGA